jgi:glutamate/aspartate transport system substrate-binding protein
MTARAALALALACGAVCAAPPPAMEASPTLRRIQDAGVISIGYREDSIPFSYLGPQQRPIGYAIELCEQVAEAVRRRLGLRDLERRWVGVSAATRFPMVATGAIDLECGSTTNTAERQRMVAFSVTTFVAATRLLARAAEPVERLSDLKGDTVVSTVGTTSIKMMQQLKDETGIDMTVTAVKNDTEAFRRVATGRARAYAMDDVLLHGQVATSGRPGDFRISRATFSVEPYAIVLRKGDPAFKALVDDTLAGLFKSGRIDAIYRRWFLSPIPPKDVNLQLPMSDALRRVIASPTDSPDPASYR